MPPQVDRDDVDERGLAIKRAPVKSFRVVFRSTLQKGVRFEFHYGKAREPSDGRLPNATMARVSGPGHV